MKEWNIILSSNPDEPVKRFRLTKSFVRNILLVLFALPVTIGILVLQITHINNEKQELLSVVEEKEAQIKENLTEIETLKKQYDELKEEALAVQLTIEEFKEFESFLSELELELPEDVEFAGSGGKELPENYVTGDVAENLIEIRKELPKLIEDFERSVDRIMEYKETLQTIPTFFPAAEGRITSKFGNRRDPFTARTSFHSGIDLAGPLNTPIYAAADGIIVQAGRNGGYGLSIRIEHESGYETLYAHLNEIEVAVGDEVKKGDIIGKMGSTGRSTGVHLHYEIYRNGEVIDPYLYITFHQNDKGLEQAKKE